MKEFDKVLIKGFRIFFCGVIFAVIQIVADFIKMLYLGKLWMMAFDGIMLLFIIRLLVFACRGYRKDYKVYENESSPS